MDNDLFLHETISYWIVSQIVTLKIWHTAARPGLMCSRVSFALEQFRAKSQDPVSPEKIEAVRADIRRAVRKCI